MNKHIPQHLSHGTVKKAAAPQSPVAAPLRAPFITVESGTDPRLTSPEAMPEVLPAPAERKRAQAPAPPRAAKGDDDLMSTQQQAALPSADELKGKWKQQVGAAKVAWGKLTEDELLRLEGHQQKLAGLVQERYAITRDEADRQVKTFFEKHRD